MNASEAYSRLLALKVPAVTTSDAAAVWGQSVDAAGKTLKRLSGAGLVRPVTHGLWWVSGDVDPYRLPEFLTSPYPAYISLQSALYMHGMVDQIPEQVFCVSLDRTRRIHTRAGTFSIHHIAPEVFGGFTLSAEGVKLATPEKALFDFLYLSGAKSRLFAALPELELPVGFRVAEVERWIRRIPSQRGRTLVSSRLRELPPIRALERERKRPRR